MSSSFLWLTLFNLSTLLLLRVLFWCWCWILEAWNVSRHFVSLPSVCSDPICRMPLPVCFHWNNLHCVSWLSSGAAPVKCLFGVSICFGNKNNTSRRVNTEINPNRRSMTSAGINVKLMYWIGRLFTFRLKPDFWARGGGKRDRSQGRREESKG